MGTSLSCPCASRLGTLPSSPLAPASASVNLDNPGGHKYACLEPRYWKVAGFYLWEQRTVMLCQFFDSFGWYAFALVQVDIAQAIFQGNGTLTWMVWAIPFFAAPIGANVVGELADRIGRKSTHTLGACLYIGGTFCQAVTPPVSVLGPIWLIICGIVQGLGAGSRFSVSCVYLAECAPQEAIAMSRAAIMVPQSLAYLVLGCFMIPFYATLSADQMVVWGWRLPFVIASVSSSIPLFFHFHAKENEEFEKAQAEEQELLGKPLGVMELVQQTWPTGLVATSGLLLECATNGLGENYINSWLVTWCGYSQIQAISLICGAHLVAIPTTLVVLSLADTFGCCTMGIGTAIYGAALSMPLYSLPYYFPGNLAVNCGVVVVLNGVMYGYRSVYLSWLSDLFPTQVRAQAAGLYINAASLSSGVAPSVCSTAPLLAGVWWLACAVVTFGALSYTLTSHHMIQNGALEGEGWLHVAYLREEPY